MFLTAIWVDPCFFAAPRLRYKVESLFVERLFTYVPETLSQWCFVLQEIEEDKLGYNNLFEGSPHRDFFHPRILLQVSRSGLELFVISCSKK